MYGLGVVVSVQIGMSDDGCTSMLRPCRTPSRSSLGLQVQNGRQGVSIILCKFALVNKLFFSKKEAYSKIPPPLWILEKVFSGPQQAQCYKLPLSAERPH